MVNRKDKKVNFIKPNKTIHLYRKGKLAERQGRKTQT